MPSRRNNSVHSDILIIGGGAIALRRVALETFNLGLSRSRVPLVGTPTSADRQRALEIRNGFAPAFRAALTSQRLNALF